MARYSRIFRKSRDPHLHEHCQQKEEGDDAPHCEDAAAGPERGGQQHTDVDKTSGVGAGQLSLRGMSVCVMARQR